MIWIVVLSAPARPAADPQTRDPGFDVNGATGLAAAACGREERQPPRASLSRRRLRRAPCDDDDTCVDVDEVSPLFDGGDRRFEWRFIVTTTAIQIAMSNTTNISSAFMRHTPGGSAH